MRRHGLDFLSAEWVFAHANNRPLACLMIDIDHFKRVNDQFGHEASDNVLAALARLLQSGSRSEDLTFRYGGEEFCTICPGASLATTRAIAERIRRNTEAERFQHGAQDIPTTVSIGLAVLAAAHASGESLIAGADAARYRAKEAGRNRVASFQVPTISTRGCLFAPAAPGVGPATASTRLAHDRRQSTSGPQQRARPYTPNMGSRHSFPQSHSRRASFRFPRGGCSIGRMALILNKLSRNFAASLSRLPGRHDRCLRS